jgi:hypothetical protein
VLNHKNVLLNRSLSHCVSQENHLEYHIISTLCTEENNTSFHLHLRENDTPNSWASSPHTGAHNIPSPSQRGTTHPSHGHTPHRGTQCSFSVSERNNTPMSWAHPTYGLSLRPIQSVYVLEDVSCNCNHQHLPKNPSSPTFWCFGDLRTPWERSQNNGNAIGDAGTSMAFPIRPPQNSETDRVRAYPID